MNIMYEFVFLTTKNFGFRNDFLILKMVSLQRGMVHMICAESIDPGSLVGI